MSKVPTDPNKWAERHAQERAEKAFMQARLESEHLDYVGRAASENKRNELFGLAWEFGHANGESEVAFYYGQMAILLNKEV